MKIYNKTKQKILVDNAEKAETLFSQMIGLMWKDAPKTIIFKTRYGIHTFFLKFPIDVMVLDSKYRVKLYKSIPAWRVFFWNPKYDILVEMPSGTLKSGAISLSDEIEFID